MGINDELFEVECVLNENGSMTIPLEIVDGCLVPVIVRKLDTLEDGDEPWDNE